MAMKKPSLPGVFAPQARSTKDDIFTSVFGAISIRSTATPANAAGRLPNRVGCALTGPSGAIEVDVDEPIAARVCRGLVASAQVQRPPGVPIFPPALMDSGFSAGVRAPE